MENPNGFIDSAKVHHLNTLYKRTRTGAIEQWMVEVMKAANRAGILTVTHGQVDGKMQSTQDVIREGKNLGKKNATDGFTQALAEAKSKWDKQKKKGYVESIDQARADQVDESVVKGGCSPMLAEKFAESGDAIVWPAYQQPKLDGHRCIAVIKKGKASLWTRSRKPFLSIPHVVAELERMFPGDTLTLDGEAYNHELRANFQKLSGLLRRDHPSPETAIAQYHVYDTCGESVASLGFGERHDFLKRKFQDSAQLVGPSSVVLQVETIEAANEDEAVVAFEHFLDQGYEGAMLRNKTGAYRFARSSGDRSVDLQKMKKFDDGEHVVVGVQEGRGKLAGHAIFVCRRDLPKGGSVEFNAKMKGPQEALKGFFGNPPLGRLLTVKYQGFYKSGKPRFPVAWRLQEVL